MSRDGLRRQMINAGASIACWIVVGVLAFVVDNFIVGSEKTILTPGGHLHQYQWFELYTWLTPSALALVALWIGYCVQRRASFLHALRQFWPPLVDSVQNAIEYLRQAEGDPAEYERLLSILRARMDDAHALFCRADPAMPPSGNTPFDGITHIHHLFQSLDVHEFVPEEENRQVRAEIIKVWQKVRGQILAEFDRVPVE